MKKLGPPLNVVMNDALLLSLLLLLLFETQSKMTSKPNFEGKKKKTFTPPFRLIVIFPSLYVL